MAEGPATRILIVDDEEAQMKALSHTLGDHGYLTTGFTSSKAALAALREHNFDLLLSDMMMPEMDGITLLRAALETDPNLIGIIMTGEGTIATAVEAMKLGAFDYILKPFKVSVILPVLARGLMLRRLRAKNAELEARVRERTAELEAANKDLESFSYSVSHDLRAPLRHIGGFSDILLNQYSSQMPEEARRLLGMVVSSTEQMGRLVEDLLRLSRLGREPLSKQPVNVVALVREVMAGLDKDKGDRSVDVQIGELPGCAGDYALLKQVFINLLSNALKFTRQKENARVEVGFQEQNGERVYFVRDNGAGFDMQYADKLFRVFQRLHRAEDFEGTGVGLSIVHRIIQRHGGRVWAEGRPDEGATFYFTLPAA
jgi:hypothetical protein